MTAGWGRGEGAAGEPRERTCWKGDPAGHHLLLPEQLVWLAVGDENTAEASTWLPQDARSLARSLSGACLGSPFLHLPGLHEAIAWKWFEGDALKAALKGSLLYDSNLSKMPPGQEPGLLTPLTPDTARLPQRHSPPFWSFYSSTGFFKCPFPVNAAS